MTHGKGVPRHDRVLHSPKLKGNGLRLWALYADDRAHEILERVGAAWRLWGRFPDRATAVREMMALAKVRGFDAVRMRPVAPAAPADRESAK